MFIKIGLTFNLYFLIAQSIFAQVQLIGKVVDGLTGQFLEQVKIYFIEIPEAVFTDDSGFFKLENPGLSDEVLVFQLKGYQRLEIPIKFELTNQPIDLGLIELLQIDPKHELDPNINQYETQNFTGLLNSRKDLFSKTVAFDFSANFFRPRFLNTNETTVMLNSVLLNKVYSGRPEWSNWGGLNDALRQQENYSQMESSQYSLGGLSYSINMISHASKQKKGLKLSMALSNKIYQNRLMLTHTSGLRSNGWSYMFSASMRYANEGYRSGTPYRAYSLLASIDKKLGKKNHINGTFIYAFNTKGKSSPMTQEVFEMKNNGYNSYWGYQQNQQRNSRVKKIVEPIIQINHEFRMNEKTEIHNHLTYQSGVSGTSRLDYGGGRLLDKGQLLVGGGTNPDPTYYQKLPSYFLRDPSNPDYGRAYLAEKEFKKEGQVKWNDLYDLNMNSKNAQHSVYALYSDEQKSSLMAMSSNLSTRISNQFSLNASLSFRINSSENYARMNDLLGGKGYLDVDLYADNLSDAQNNLKDPNRVVLENEKFRYHYQLESQEANIFLKSTYSSKKTNLYLGVQFTSINYERNGLYENGFYPNSLSFGKSKKLKFNPFALKLGVSHKLDGRHHVLYNLSYLEKAPIFNSIFSNVRVSNEIVQGLINEKNVGVDLKYVWRNPNFLMHFSGYYLWLTDASRVSYYYADGLTGLENMESSAYVQEILTGIDRKSMGIEFSLELPLIPNFRFKCVAAIGKSVYASNPQMYLDSNTFTEPLYLGKSFLKGYYSSGGPQHAYSIGFEYSNPNYWWLSSSFNYFDKLFLSIAPLTRTRNFFLDTDGLPILDLDTELVKSLLGQESLSSYGSINLVGGKSWKIKNTYVGLFAAINNLTNNIYKTGGFEQSRTANYTTMKEDKTRIKPLFGPKYWFGFGTTFYTSFYIRI